MIPRFVSWVTAFADAKSLPVSQTHMLRRLFSGERKARRFPSGEIAAPLIFGLSKKSLRGISRDLSVVCATKEYPANKPQINSSKIETVLISLQILVEVLVGRLRD
jgi:hypothetical protein